MTSDFSAVPDRVTMCGLPEASLVIVSEPLTDADLRELESQLPPISSPR